VVAKENKIVFIAPIPKTDQLTAPTSCIPTSSAWPSNTTIEGRSAAEIVAKWPVTRSPR
jgi:branched-chain amino acid transport system substrate-binding protein